MFTITSDQPLLQYNHILTYDIKLYIIKSIHTYIHAYIHTYIHTYIFVIDLNECGNRMNNFYPFGIEAKDTLFIISPNHSSDSIQNLSVLVNREVFVSLICNYVQLDFDRY